MKGYCIRCKRPTPMPIKVESRDDIGRCIFRAVFCFDCHQTMIREQEEAGHD